MCMWIAWPRGGMPRASRTFPDNMLALHVKNRYPVDIRALPANQNHIEPSLILSLTTSDEEAYLPSSPYPNSCTCLYLSQAELSCTNSFSHTRLEHSVSARKQWKIKSAVAAFVKRLGLISGWGARQVSLWVSCECMTVAIFKRWWTGRGENYFLVDI